MNDLDAIYRWQKTAGNYPFTETIDRWKQMPESEKQRLYEKWKLMDEMKSRKLTKA